MTGRRVLVTRPQPGAANTARRLQEMGFSPIMLPLTQTRTLPVVLANAPVTADAVAVTSVNAIRHAPPDLVARLAGLRCFAVGKKTAAVAAAAGFSHVIQGPGDASGLAAMIAKEAKPGAHIAYLTGRVRLEAFEARLADAGTGVFPIETYDTLAVDHGDAELSQLLGDAPVDAILLYSSGAAEATMRIRNDPRWSSSFSQARYFCLSARIATTLLQPQNVHVSIAPEPSEDALLALLAGSF